MATIPGGREIPVAHWREPAPGHALGFKERQWVRATLDGDLAAFHRLMERHWQKIGSLVARFLTVPNDIEDALHDTFVRVFECQRPGPPRQPVSDGRPRAPAVPDQPGAGATHRRAGGAPQEGWLVP